MRRVVLDSSVFVSAFVTPKGTVARMLDAVLASPIELCVSHAILEETAHTLLTKPRLRRYATYDDAAATAWLDMLAELAVIVEPVTDLAPICRDPADDVIVATAVAAKAEWLITGDDDLLVLDPYQDIRIVTPRAFLELLDGL